MNIFRISYKSKKRILTAINSSSIVVAILLFSLHSFGQTKEDEVVQEGKLIYRTAIAVEYGSEIVKTKYPVIKGISSTNVAYLNATQSVCIFFSDTDPSKIVLSISFNSEGRIENATINNQLRDASSQEQSLYKMMKTIEADVSSTSSYKKYGNTKFMFVPINDSKGKRVYLLTSSEKEGVITFGNDYLVTFDSDNSINKRIAIHKNLMWTEIETKEKGKDITEAWHTHLPETGNKITATDIYTILRYEKITRWKKYSVITETLVSVWDCSTDNLMYLPRQEWDKILVKK